MTKISKKEKQDFAKKLQKIFAKTRNAHFKEVSYRSNSMKSNAGQNRASRQEYEQIIEAIASIAKRSGWKKDNTVVGYNELILSREKQFAYVTLILDSGRQRIIIKIEDNVDLNDPKSLDKIHRIFKGKKKIKK